MLTIRIGNLITKTVEKCNTINVNIVRWKRKPRWLPTAKSKLFRVPERKKKSPLEYQELSRLHNCYRTQLRSVYSYLREEVQRKNETSADDHLVVSPEEEEAEFEKCLQENNLWNAKIAAERNKRLEEAIEKRRNSALKGIESAREKQIELQQKIEEIVRMEKEKAKSFITEDKLDSTIEYILANPKDYNFSIDMDGNMYDSKNSPTSSSSSS